MSTEYGRTQNFMLLISSSGFELGSLFTELKFQYVAEYPSGVFIVFYLKVYKKLIKKYFYVIVQNMLTFALMIL
jgi:hypothetical protein